MLTLYRRGGEAIRIETGFAPATRQFVLVVTRPAGLTRTERFSTEVEMGMRILYLEMELERDGWTRQTAT